MIDAELARGAFGVVYRGRLDDRAVAIKRLEVDVVDDDVESVSTRHFEFCHEARVMATLRHANLVALFAVVAQPLSLVMELCIGGDVAALLRANLPSDLTDALRCALALDAARGLDYMHSRDVVHCDVRTPNIFLLLESVTALEAAVAQTRNNNNNNNNDVGERPVLAKVADFGLSRRAVGVVNERLGGW